MKLFTHPLICPMVVGIRRSKHVYNLKAYPRYLAAIDEKIA
jgi:hypothetical protein